MKKDITCHKDLRVWRKSTTLARECLAAVSTLPDVATRLGSQIRRKAESISYEIERGYQFQQLAPYLHHLNRARTRVEAQAAVMSGYRLTSAAASNYSPHRTSFLPG